MDVYIRLGVRVCREMESKIRMAKLASGYNCRQSCRERARAKEGGGADEIKNEITGLEMPCAFL